MNGTWSIWPSGRLFEEEFRGWDGEWNTACEQWFMDSWSQREGQAFVSSGREWKHNLRQVIVEGLPQDVKNVAPEAWSTTLERLRVDMASQQLSVGYLVTHRVVRLLFNSGQ